MQVLQVIWHCPIHGDFVRTVHCCRGRHNTHQAAQTALERCGPRWLWSRSHAGPFGWWRSVEQDLARGEKEKGVELGLSLGVSTQKPGPNKQRPSAFPPPKSPSGSPDSLSKHTLAMHAFHSNQQNPVTYSVFYTRNSLLWGVEMFVSLFRLVWVGLAKKGAWPTPGWRLISQSCNPGTEAYVTREFSIKPRSVTTEVGRLRVLTLQRWITHGGNWGAGPVP